MECPVVTALLAGADVVGESAQFVRDKLADPQSAEYFGALLSFRDRYMYVEEALISRAIAVKQRVPHGRPASLLYTFHEYRAKYGSPGDAPRGLTFRSKIEVSQFQEMSHSAEPIHELLRRYGVDPELFQRDDVIIAGGTPNKAMMYGQSAFASEDTHVDIDVFLMGSCERCQHTLLILLKALVAVNDDVTRRVGVTYQDHVVNCVIRNEAERNPTNQRAGLLTIQFVLRCYTYADEVPIGFDVDSCCVVMYQGRLLATPRGWRSFETRTNYVDPDRQSASFASRLLKYKQRGYGVCIPMNAERLATCRTICALSKTASGRFCFKKHGVGRVLGVMLYGSTRAACFTACADGKLRTASRDTNKPLTAFYVRSFVLNNPFTLLICDARKRHNSRSHLRSVWDYITKNNSNRRMEFDKRYPNIKVWFPHDSGTMTYANWQVFTQSAAWLTEYPGSQATATFNPSTTPFYDVT